MKLITDVEYTELVRSRPKQLVLLPNRAKDLKLNPEPHWAKATIETDLPIRENDRTEKDDPKCN